MSELTNADGFKIVTATHHKRTGDVNVTDSISIDRWSDYGKDRLYLNGLKTGDGWISLKSDESGGDRWTKVSAERELDGDELTITVGNKRTIYTIVVKVNGDDFMSGSEDSDDSENESEGKPEIVTDGGQDTTDHIDDATIESALTDELGVPDHPDDPDIETIRDALAWVQQSMAEVWADWCSNIEHNEAEVVYEDSDVIIFATSGDDVPRRDLREYYDGDLHERTPDVVSRVHHKLARDRTDYDWGYAYPLVVRKPETWDAGQQYVDAVINSLQKRGLSPGQAWAYYGVEIKAESQSAWARRQDRTQQQISNALKQAKQKLP